MSINVLLADDHAVLRDGLRLLLSSEPDIIVVGEAANGREAVEKALECYPDVAILDIAMPEMNGIEAARQIADVCPGTQVLVLSMYSSSEHISRALQAGVRGYLLKESVGNEVLSAIRDVHAGRFYMGRKIANMMVNSPLQPLVTTGCASEPQYYGVASVLEK
jgi:DNA-binding NarL/FixJ family response regulator